MSHSPNQAAFWNGPAAAQWVRHQDMLDAMLAPMTAPLLEMFQPAKGAAVLDIGCGAGTTTMALAARGYRPLGVDVSAPLLAYAKKRAAEAGSRARFVEADAGAAQLPAPPYGGLFSRFGVMFFEDPKAAFAHLRAALQPDAPLAFVCWRDAAENAWNLVPLRALAPLLKEPPPPMDPDAPGPMAFANPERTRGILEGAGWRDVAIKAWDGEITLGGDIEATADFMATSSAARFTAGQNLDPVVVKQRIAEAMQDFVAADGSVRTPAACWIVTARA